MAHARQPDPGAEAALDAAALERQFWRCDAAAAQTRLDIATVQICSQVTERLRTLRFGGDLDAMLAWWHANKAAQHAALAATRP